MRPLPLAPHQPELSLPLRWMRILTPRAHQERGERSAPDWENRSQVQTAEWALPDTVPCCGFSEKTEELASSKSSLVPLRFSEYLSRLRLRRMLFQMLSGFSTPFCHACGLRVYFHIWLCPFKKAVTCLFFPESVCLHCLPLHAAFIQSLCSRIQKINVMSAELLKKYDVEAYEFSVALLLVWQIATR